MVNPAPVDSVCWQPQRLSTISSATLPAAPATGGHDPDAYPIHEFLVNCWIVQYIATVLPTARSSELRMQDEALIQLSGPFRYIGGRPGATTNLSVPRPCA